jgi:hypothetical protein
MSRKSSPNPETHCDAPLNIAGEPFFCDKEANHYGWPHANVASKAIWGPVPEGEQS